MTPEQHAALPARVHLAKTLLAHTHGGRGYDVYVPRAVLYRYVTAAEDTIEQQAKMLTDDADNLDQDRAARAKVERLAAHADREARAEIGRLRTENASLRELVLEAIDAALAGDGEAIATARRAALERTA